MNVGTECSRNCRQCFYKEKGYVKIDDEISFIERVSENFPKSSVFIYPKDVSNNTNYLTLMKNYGQDCILIDGLNVSDEFIEKARNAKIREIQLTLFGTSSEQEYYNKNSKSEYYNIIDNVKKLVKNKFSVTINNILDKTTKRSIPNISSLASDLGASKVKFYRILPIGNAKDMDSANFIYEPDMLEVISLVEEAKQNYKPVYFSFALNFGPNFYGKTIESAIQKVKKSSKEWTKSEFLCPAINQNYLGISSKTKNIYWCFFLISEPDIAKIGYVKDDIPVFQKKIDLTTATLKEKLRGNCSKESCEYQSVCLGGCRATAYIFAKAKGESDPLYSGMDICLTKSYQEFNKLKEAVKM